MRLKQSIYVLVSPIFMIFAMLACAGTPLLDVPSVTCPTPVQPTVLPGTPPPTPVVISAPADFYIGDNVIVGNVSSPLRVQFRLLDVQTYPTSPDNYGNPRQIVSWRLRVKNIGTQDYEIFPSVQLFISEVNGLTGTWAARQYTGDLVGIAVDSDLYQLTSGQTEVYHFATLTPVGRDLRFSFQLYPAQGTNSPVMTWINQTNPYC